MKKSDILNSRHSYVLLRIMFFTILILAYLGIFTITGQAVMEPGGEPL